MYLLLNNNIFKYNRQKEIIEDLIDLPVRCNFLTIKNNILYSGDDKGEIYKIDTTLPPQTPDSIKKITDLPEWEGVLGLTINDNILYAGTHDGKIYKIDLGTGRYEVNLFTKLLSYAHIPALTFKNNNLYVGNTNGEIYKIETTLPNQEMIAFLELQVLGLIFKGNDLYAGTGTYEDKIYKIN